MDHLKTPEDDEPLGLTVPCFFSSITPHDGEDYHSYPAKAGYVLDGGVLPSECFTSHPAGLTASIVQEWLFFGLLREVLGTFYTRSDFVTADDRSHTGARVTTANLPSALESVKQYYKHIAEFGFSNTFGSARRVHQTSPSRDVGDILDFALEQTREMDRPLPSPLPGWPELLLSINVLIESLRTLASKGFDSYDAKMSAGSLIAHPDAPSAMAVGSRLLTRRGWCVHQYRRVCKHVSYSSLYYLGTIRRYAQPWIDHTACLDTPRCVAYNVRIETYRTLHVKEHCKCDAARAPEAQMHAILKEGGIPVLRCARKGEEFSLTYTKASPFLPYVAISHLWADGLGNPLGNYVPHCRLKRLYEHVMGLYHDFAKIRNMLMQEGYAPGRLSRAFDNMTNRTRLHSRPEGPEVVSIWLDVYCVPTIPTAVPRVSGHDVGNGAIYDLQALKIAALNRMPATYAWSGGVLVYDSELNHISEHHDFAETMARLVLCGWNSRSWTFQEMNLAQRVLLYCENGPRVEINVGNQYGWSRHKDTTYFDVVAQHDVYKLEDTHSESYNSLTAMLGKKRVVNGVHSPPLLRPGRFRAEQLAESWNQLAHRNTTRHQDALSILANLVDLPAGSVLELHEEDRMKAILKTFQRLPLGILTADIPRFSDLNDGNERLCTDGERWIPRVVEGDLLMRDHREPAIDAIEVRDNGLSIRSPLFNPKDLAGLTMVSVTPPPGPTWLLNARGGTPKSHPRTERVRVRLNQNGGAGAPDPEQHILLLDHCFHSMNFQRIKDRGDHGRGALLKISRSTQSSVHVTFVCSLTFSPHSVTDDSYGKDPEMSECHGEICRNDKDLVLDCDITTWPDLVSRRARGRYRRIRFLMRMIVLFSLFPLMSGVLITLLGLTLRLTDFDTSLGLHMFHLGIVAIVLTLAVSLTAWTLRSFFGFLNMHSWFHEGSSGLRWFERLEDMMPAAETVIGPRLRSEAKMVWVLTKVVAWPVRTYHSFRGISTWMIRHRGKDKERSKGD